MKYKVVPIPSEIIRSVRENMKSPQYGHPAFASLATGYGPCRSCLKTFEEGKEERILFTYNSFEGLSGLPSPGPVFIHKDICAEFAGDGYPPEILDLPQLFEAFGAESELLRREPIERDNIDAQIERLLAIEGAKFINIRNSEAGCYIGRVHPN